MLISGSRFGRRVPFRSVGSPTTFLGFLGIELASKDKLYQYSNMDSFIIYMFVLVSLRPVRLSAKMLKVASITAKGIIT
jgi:hypothetical protein